MVTRSTQYVPLQGDIIRIDLGPPRGHEQKGYRPYICLSNELISRYANIAIFAPISTTNRSYPLYIALRDSITEGIVMLDQLVTIDYNARNTTYVETVSEELLDELLETVKVIFQKD
ncbi:MAG: type II toxin-antitoxin system PemK/MazF family toxin [Clostridiales Family XIII bacterium]|jgi:mRNA interferase MazF|nr:type II toxin-antitoxin system PemK/MazF family toxin [Clostridiales Family XIII bacterium]